MMRFRKFNAECGVKVPPIHSATLRVLGMQDGDYEVQWWDAYAGRIAETATATATNGELTVKTPPVPTDIACKLIFKNARK